jgi:hypothetical protein
MTEAVPATDAETEKVRAWLQAHLGGEVVDLRRQPRWRPVWFADVERRRERLELCVRGDRTDMPLIFPLDHEMRLQAIMHDHGIPTPKVYGWIDEPKAYVMDRVARAQRLRGSRPRTSERPWSTTTCTILARLHALDIAPFVDGGIMRAARPEESGTFGMSRYEHVYRSTEAVSRPVPRVLPRLAAPQPARLEGPRVGHRLGLRDSSTTGRPGRRRPRRRDRPHRRPDDGPGGVAHARHRHRLRQLPRALRPLRGAQRPCRSTSTPPAPPLRLHAVEPAPARRRAARPGTRVRPHDQPAVVLRDQPVRHRGAGRDPRRRAAHGRDARAARVAGHRRRSSTWSATCAP